MQRMLCTMLLLLLAFMFGCDMGGDESSTDTDDATMTGTVMLVSSYTPDYIRPLNGATVSTEPETTEVKADADGYFGINAPNGRYRLTARGKGEEPGFTTWIEVSDDFHPNVIIPLREFDEGLAVYEAMLTDAETDVIDESHAKTMFAADTKRVYFLMEHSLLGEEDVVDLVWLKDGEEVTRMEDVDLEDIWSSSDSLSNIARFSISAEDDSMPDGYYYVQLRYRQFGSKRFDEPEIILSLPFYVEAPEPEDLSKQEYDITVINEWDESIRVHLDGEFQFDLWRKMPGMVQKDTIEDITGGEHTLTFFNDDGDLVGSETIVLDSDVTITFKFGWVL